MKLSADTFQFLNKLVENNTREWFADNKPEFDTIQKDVKQFYKAIQEKLEAHDEIEKHKFFRIYRDVRFSKDKTPYKTHFAGSFSRNGAHLRGGYYLRLKPGESFLAGGFWEPNKEDLFRIRKEIEIDASEFRDILADAEFQKYFGDKFEGDELKTAPKGFDKTHPDIDLIRKKGYIAIRNFTDKEVLSSNFINEIDVSYKALRPFFDLMSSVLTTNLNGESIL
ncbi:DUF2461 domain-containing protein [Tenacibaculum jejuense]|uniref:TIGR02453 family protein n=1 Tax=Tenacibaculum jejuense TaxID=584609 RepID=A0A238UA77_9FLAO|nr:DUF2461 domain-containing protein [Tenacibaculum jejuense]SNR15896.1 conserved protein of unknown function [Tenacibaculum jejuense]